MRRFVKNIILFMIPVLALIALFTSFYYVGVTSGEFYDFERIMDVQNQNKKAALGLGYNEQTPYFKLLMADSIEADVLVLGTSRSMQFKGDYFNKKFYNCGGAVHGNYREYINYLQNLSYVPEIMILDLDSWVFNDNWNKGEEDYLEYTEIAPVERDKIVMTKQMILDWIDKKWTFDSIKKYPDNIGFNGRIKDDGFYFDGSYHYGEVGRDLTLSSDYGFPDSFERIDKGISRFEYGESVDTDTMNQLKELLEYCEEQNIYVVAYHAPFAPSVYERMKQNGNYGYLDEITPLCKRLFDDFGYEYYDFCDSEVLTGVTDEYFADGFHGSEVVYAMMIEDMVESGSVLSEAVDLEYLKEIIKDRYNNILLENPDVSI